MRPIGLGLAFLSPVLIACAKPYEVVKQAPVSPVAVGAPIVLREPKAGEISVDGKPERELLARLSPDEQRRWVTLLGLARTGILKGLADNRGRLVLTANGSGPTVDVELTAVELAKQSPRATPKTALHAVLRVWREAKVQDEIRVVAIIEAEVVSSDEIESSRERRFRRAGVDLGRQVAEYLRSRAGAD